VIDRPKHSAKHGSGIATALCCLLTCSGSLFANASPAAASASVDHETATQFFMRVGDHLLRSQLNLTLTNLSIHPANHYSGDVHRILQVTANLYDSMNSREESHPCCPTVFRPLFGTENGSNFIRGYVELTDISFLNNDWMDHTSPALDRNDNVYGIPLVIGAKKGLPNFNEFSIESVVQITRLLEVHKPDTNSPPNLTNQMYLLSISNVFGIEAWNSYFTNYTRPTELRVHHSYEGFVTNETGLALLSSSIASPVLSKPITHWPGARAGWQLTNSIEIPYLSGHLFLANSQYHETPPHFRAVPSNSAGASFDSPSGFPNPAWQMVVTNNIRYALIDITDQRILDFIHLGDLITHFNISSNLYSTVFPGEEMLGNNLWDTNRIGGSTDVMVSTRGVQNQIGLSLGMPQIDASMWNAFSSQGPSGPQIDQAIAVFQKFMGFTPSPPFQDLAMPTNLVMRTPFNPVRKIYFRQTWQANDPLVHYTLDDLVDPSRPPVSQPIVPPSLAYTNFSQSNLGKLNERYAPWGGRREPGGSPLNTSGSFQDYYYGIKDPGVRWSDDWDFPEGNGLDLREVGRIHRGTPWQTIYLKSSPAPPNQWLGWSMLSHPTNDWKLVSTLLELFNATPAFERLSVNETNLNAWAPLLTGLSVATDGACSISPLEADSPEIEFIVAAINRTRASFPGGRFVDVTDILATPELSNLWPGLSSGDLWSDCFNDARWELIPAQLLPLLRSDLIATVARGNDLVEVRFRVPAGGSYDIQISTDLKTWGNLRNLVATNSFLTFSEPVGAGSRFYRAVWKP
jgi:hypothetical protein